MGRSHVLVVVAVLATSLAASLITWQATRVDRAVPDDSDSHDSGPDTESQDSLRRRIDTLERENHELRRARRRAGPTASAREPPPPAPPPGPVAGTQPAKEPGGAFFSRDIETIITRPENVFEPPPVDAAEIPDLIRTLRESAGVDKAKALAAHGRLVRAGDLAVRQLFDLARDPSERAATRQLALNALRKIGPMDLGLVASSVLGTIGAHKDVREEALHAVREAAQRGEPLGQSVRSLALDPAVSLHERRLALQALVIADPEGALVPLRDMVDGGDAPERDAGTSVLVASRRKELLPYLIELVHRDPRPNKTAELLQAIALTKDRRWSTKQLTGEPDTPMAGDLPTAWASKRPEMGEVWIELTYAVKLRPYTVRIHETLGPGAVMRVEARQGTEWIVLWEGTAGEGRAPRWFAPALANVDFETDRMRLVLDTNRVQGWNEIDAVELSDGSTRLWAAAATASSSYADN